MSEAAGDRPASGPERRLAGGFRWQTFFQRATDPLFVLNRRCRLLFVNRAWEALTGLDAAAAALLECRRPTPASPDNSPEEMIAHALTPPPEARQGAACRVRRLLPGRPPGQRWWEVEYLPLAQEGKQGGFLLVGRIRVLAGDDSAATVLLPERLVNLRQRAISRLLKHPWESTLPALRRLLAQVRLASQVSAPVLLVGEPGVGKHTLARLIHYQGPQGEKPFAALDCQRLPPSALAGILFGERGGGPAELGALYLKEPGHLPRDLQLRLAGWLTSAGEGPALPRILAGSQAPLQEEARSGRLLEELACALGMLVLEVPPLRERQADLPALVSRLLERANEEGDRQVLGLSSDAWELLRGHTWPGNVSELYTVLKAARSRASGERIAADDLPLSLRRAGADFPLRPVERPLALDTLLEQTERRLIEVALRRTGGHKGRAADLLGIWRGRLSRRLEALGAEEGDRPAEEPPVE